MDQDEEHDNLASLDRPQPSPSTSQLKRPPRKAYAGRSGRELSTSAAKRQSVMALGSIKHLQHMYAKNGLASNSPYVMGILHFSYHASHIADTTMINVRSLAIDASGRNLPLALPGHDPSSNNILESPEEDLPPS